MGKTGENPSTSKYILLGGTGMLVVILAMTPVSPAHAAGHHQAIVAEEGNDP
ncbi:hypothetical protein HY256_00335 [Candidatus Sumerlaeota bacterium]|nr:hypothetical protein [Candidatus Sumerlaeota bacterium]